MAVAGLLSFRQTGRGGAVRLAPARTAARYRATLFTDWGKASGRWQGELGAGAAATPFQSAEWLEAFHAAARQDPAIEPLIVFLDDAQSGAFALALPLIRRRANGAARIEFADLGMTDFNAPLLGPAAPCDGAEVLAALREVLPDADLLDLKKMPPVIGGRTNPLAYLAGARASAVNGNLIELGEDFDAWRASLSRQQRKEMDRHWRVFCRHEGAAFRIVRDPGEALALLPKLEAMQRQRLEALGEPYMLDNPVTVALHRHLMTKGIAQGFCVLGLLTAGQQVVAAAAGVRRGDAVVMIRLCQAGADWSNCSPGRLVLAQTLRHVHGEGCRKFDLGIGNFAYKRRFAVMRQPLMDVTAALTWRGLPALLRGHAGAWVRRYPQWRRRLRRLTGKPISREED